MIDLETIPMRLNEEGIYVIDRKAYEIIYPRTNFQRFIKGVRKLVLPYILTMGIYLSNIKINDLSEDTQ